MEQSLSDTQHRLSVKMNELHAAHQQIEKLEERIGTFTRFRVHDYLCCTVCSISFDFSPGELSQHGSKHKEDVAHLQRSISALDKEKDALQDDVDQKAEKLVVLQEELSMKVAIAEKQ